MQFKKNYAMLGLENKNAAALRGVGAPERLRRCPTTYTAAKSRAARYIIREFRAFYKAGIVVLFACLCAFVKCFASGAV